MRVLAVAAALVASAAGVGASPTLPAREGLLVVELEPGTSAATRAASMRRIGLEIVDTTPGSRFVLARGSASTARPGGPVRSVREPVIQRVLSVPNDPLYRLQWNLPMVQAPAAWDVSTGAGAVVAVIDTGVAINAPDLAGVSFAAGFDWVDNDSDPSDPNGHGTHVAGIVAQRTNNAVGVAGLAHGSTIMPLRALDARGAGLDYNVAAAIRHATDHGADVVNLSLGAAQGSLVLQDAVRYAALNGVTIVAAAGNDGAAAVAYPAAYPEVIAVGAVRFDRTRVRYSNTGNEVELVAPGGDLSVDQNADGYGDGILQQTLAPQGDGSFCYCFFQGTSMASPHVAGAAALIAATGVTDRQAIREALASAAMDLGPAGRDVQFGHGLLQVFDALQAAQALSGEPSPEQEPLGPPPPATPTPEPVPTPRDPRDIDDACPGDQVPRGQFTDVRHDSVHAAAIDCAAWSEIARGTSDHTYSPGLTVTREQMASFLARLIERSGHDLPAAPPDAFADDSTSVHHLRINQLAAVGIVNGSIEGTYGPREAVSRGAMASFLARTHDLISDQDLPPAGDYFDDDDGNVHEAQIDRIAAAGIAAGTANRTYSPRADVRRDQLATFLMRTLDLLIETGAAPPST